MHRCTLIQRGRLQARSRPGDKHIRTDNVVYSSWFASESEEAPPSDKWSAPCVLSCSDSCSLVGMEFFFGRPLGLVGDSSPPPCNTFEAATIHISLDFHMYHNFYAKYNLRFFSISFFCFDTMFWLEADSGLEILLGLFCKTRKMSTKPFLRQHQYVLCMQAVAP